MKRNAVECDPKSKASHHSADLGRPFPAVRANGQAEPGDLRQWHGPFEGRHASCWLEAASRLPGRSLHTAVALLNACRLAQSPCVSLNNIFGRSFGVQRNAKYRALTCLEEAGLVVVERRRGMAPIVNLMLVKIGGS